MSDLSNMKLEEIVILRTNIDTNFPHICPCFEKFYIHNIILISKEDIITNDENISNTN